MSTLLYTGTSQSHPIRRVQAGPLTALYENGFLRYVKLGDDEVVRMIYFALRDARWNTLDWQLTDEQVEIGEQSFRISYTGGSFEGVTEIIRWQAQLTGDASGRIDFGLEGEVLVPFWRNRAGLCVLHSLAETVGRPAIVETPDGRTVEGIFPESITLQQPFQDIAVLRWTLPHQDVVQLSVAGDVFETEDQRNWGDASFKTYCTPVRLPMPVHIEPGDRISQRVTLELVNRSAEERMATAQQLRLVRPDGPENPLPVIGLCQALDTPKLKTDEVTQLRRMAPHHLRIELNFGRPDWSEWFTVGLSEAKKLQAEVLLAISFTDNYPAELDYLQQAVSWLGVQAWAVEVFSLTHPATPDGLLTAVAEPLRALFPGALLGAGTTGPFVDLQGATFETDRTDYLVCSLNPQMHLTGDWTVIENKDAHADTVRSMQALLPSTAIHVGPVSLRQRLSGVPTNFDTDWPADIDPRQPSLLAAGWFLGSLASLTSAGAARVTFFDTKGGRGVIQGLDAPLFPDRFSAEPGDVFPVGLVLQLLADWKGAVAKPIAFLDPVQGSALWLTWHDRHLLVLANHSPEPQTVDLGEWPVTPAEVCVLDEITAPAAIKTGTLPPVAPFAETAITLNPFAIVALMSA
ncbi:hypothetical protein F5984_00995 [Rudanella paleaurantiibacter]|uniref:Uncharacterized protein n=1 Tax=Rudanella paleaurantiibacter TaxID=2614655 RepID=A0A7J5U3Z4_9BACT|nr:hypothetical protein [Rudanella paleaurantiibacter]KAB7732564.1 hypothetical protein F5984_00995 [Rudanella paleaurantiibacter]